MAPIHPSGSIHYTQSSSLSGSSTVVPNHLTSLTLVPMVPSHLTYLAVVPMVPSHLTYLAVVPMVPSPVTIAAVSSIIL